MKARGRAFCERRPACNHGSGTAKIHENPARSPCDRQKSRLNNVHRLNYYSARVIRSACPRRDALSCEPSSSGSLNFLIPSTGEGVAGSTENCVRRLAINLLHVHRARRSYLHIEIHSRPGAERGESLLAKSSTFTERRRPFSSFFFFFFSFSQHRPTSALSFRLFGAA